MKSVLLLLIGVIVLTAGCSSAADNQNTENHAAETAIAKESSPAVAEHDASSLLPTPSPAPTLEEKPAKPEGAQVLNPEESASAPDSTPPDRLARIRQSKAETPGAPGIKEIEALRTTREGPENSYYYTELGKIAVETRVFRSHPILSKIEKLNDGRSQSIKVYLRDGRIVALPGGAVRSVFTASSAEILAASGIKADAGRKAATGNGTDGGDAKNEEKNRPR